RPSGALLCRRDDRAAEYDRRPVRAPAARRGCRYGASARRGSSGPRDARRRASSARQDRPACVGLMVEGSAPRRNLWWPAPPVAALFYPMALRALYESGALLQRASGPKAATAWLAIVASVALVYSVPVLGIVVADRLGRAQTTSSRELFARRLSHLVVAAPSIFVLMGVVFFLLHAPNGDVLCWSIVWLIAIASMARTMRRGGDEALAPSTPNPIPLRMAHGCSALAIVLIFLVWHLLNHASAALSLQVEEATMSALRQWYRSEYVQPVLVV